MTSYDDYLRSNEAYHMDANPGNAAPRTLIGLASVYFGNALGIILALVPSSTIDYVIKRTINWTIVVCICWMVFSFSSIQIPDWSIILQTGTERVMYVRDEISNFLSSFKKITVDTSFPKQDEEDELELFEQYEYDRQFKDASKMTVAQLKKQLDALGWPLDKCGARVKKNYVDMYVRSQMCMDVIRYS